MDKQKTIFDYIFQVFAIFGFSIFVLNIFCLIFGSNAQGYSSIFKLGNDGVSVETLFEFLCLCILIIAARFLFFTDKIIKTMSLPLRSICMVLAVIAAVGVFAAVFNWFPIDLWQAWVSFLVCFGICFVASYFVMRVKENAENKKLNDALLKLKESQNEQK